MATPQQLSQTYSFIPVLLADSTVMAYGNNSLPLFAVALHLDIEDIGSFATESLTDHPSDKKADIIYINEADGLACVAQGYMAQDWGKGEALANKASDLCCAAAWLLQTPIDDVPEAIRSHAKLLRDGLQSGSITRLAFAYAHNQFESVNVDAELETVRHLLKGLPSTAGVDIEVVELGLRRIEALHLTSLGAIQVVDKIDLPAGQRLYEEGPSWRAFVLSLNGAVLHGLYEKYGNALFSANLRDFLGARKMSGNVNNKIKDTTQKDPGNFFVFNNGITMITKKATLLDDETLRITGLSIVNGAQTTGAIHAAGSDHAKNVSVSARIVVVENDSMIPGIVAGNNTQNSIVAWDRRSNDPRQVRIKQEFESRGVEYVHRRDSSRKSATSIFANQVGQMLCAFAGDLQTAIRARSDIFESDVTYDKVFPADISIGHVYAVQALGWAYDSVKQELKARSDQGTETQLESRQLRLLDYPASKQFVLTIFGSLREELAGAQVSKPQAFELKHEVIGANRDGAVDAWINTLKSILPTIVQNLPAEEYQVVRSTDHTTSVAERTKGIVAGAQVLQDSFGDLRGLLKAV